MRIINPLSRDLRIIMDVHTLPGISDHTRHQ